MKSFTDRVNELSQKGVQHIEDIHAQKKVSAIVRGFLALNNVKTNKTNWQSVLESLCDVATHSAEDDTKRKAAVDIIRLAGADDAVTDNRGNGPIGPLTININGVKPDQSTETISIVSK